MFKPKLGLCCEETRRNRKGNEREYKKNMFSLIPTHTHTHT